MTRKFQREIFLIRKRFMNSAKCRVQYFFDGSKEAAFVKTNMKNNMVILYSYDVKIIIANDLYLSHVLRNFFD